MQPLNMGNSFVNDDSLVDACRDAISSLSTLSRTSQAEKIASFRNMLFNRDDFENVKDTVFQTRKFCFIESGSENDIYGSKQITFVYKNADNNISEQSLDLQEISSTDEFDQVLEKLCKIKLEEEKKEVLGKIVSSHKHLFCGISEIGQLLIDDSAIDDSAIDDSAIDESSIANLVGVAKVANLVRVPRVPLDKVLEQNKFALWGTSIGGPKLELVYKNANTIKRIPLSLEQMASRDEFDQYLNSVYDDATAKDPLTMTTYQKIRKYANNFKNINATGSQACKFYLRESTSEKDIYGNPKLVFVYKKADGELFQGRFDLEKITSEGELSRYLESIYSNLIEVEKKEIYQEVYQEICDYAQRSKIFISQNPWLIPPLDWSEEKKLRELSLDQSEEKKLLELRLDRSEEKELLKANDFCIKEIIEKDVYGNRKLELIYEQADKLISVSLDLKEITSKDKCIEYLKTVKTVNSCKELRKNIVDSDVFVKANDLKDINTTAFQARKYYLRESTSEKDIDGDLKFVFVYKNAKNEWGQMRLELKEILSSDGVDQYLEDLYERSIGQ